MNNEQNFVFIITGPTASGKTAFADQLAQLLDCEVINVDVGQFYTPLSVGTAKPDWKKFAYPCHLFDILDEPKDLTVVQYRTMVLEKVKEIQNRGRTPVLVGGSLFYIKSIFSHPISLNSMIVHAKSFLIILNLKNYGIFLIQLIQIEQLKSIRMIPIV